MDPLDNITKNTLDIAEAAREAFKKGDIRNCKEHLLTILYYLAKKITKWNIKSKKGLNMLIQTSGTQFMKASDKESYDFTLNDFTRDYEYHDLDLSSLVPSGAKAVMLWGAFKSETADCEGNFAQYGHTGEYLKTLFFEPIANIGCNIDCIIPLSSERKIKYRFSNVTYLYINLSVAAWFM